MSRPYHEKWGDMRTNCDEALKLVGMLPSAVSTVQDDPGFIEQVTRDLSNHLCCLDASIGDERPAQLVTVTSSEPRTGKDGKTTPDDRFPAAYVTKRDNEIASWLTELTELVSEMLAEEAPIDREQIAYLHERIWRMRRTFGFAPMPANEGEASE